tara:strand:+ start:11963 stop:12622 length:660 start_codon:yes stop_codon:yes gene_type:complete
MKKIILFGTGQFSEVATFYLENFSDEIIEAYAVHEKYITEESFKGKPLVPFEKVKEKYPTQKYKLFVPFNYNKVNRIRESLYQDGLRMGYEFASYIDPYCRCNADQVGENCFILENNTIQPYSKIGNNVIIWSGNHIGHHSLISDHCFISSHVVVSGGVQIGENSFLGVNSTIRDNIKIGYSNVIGAGAIILSNTNDYAVYPSIHTEKSGVPSNRLRRI